MNCANHPETPASAYCRECGKPMCEECRQPALGSVYCSGHLPAEASPAMQPVPPAGDPQPRETPSPYTANPYAGPPAGPPDHGPLPLLAFFLGFIPGVGAIYNGQYSKGLIHAIVFGLLVTLAGNDHGSLEPLLGIGIAVWVFYMAFEAYHTARKRRYGQEVEEFSSLLDMNRSHARVPGGPLVLIAIGVLLLLDTTGIIRLDELERYWPVGLIVLGLYLLYIRLNGPAPAGAPRSESHPEAGQ